MNLNVTLRLKLLLRKSLGNDLGVSEYEEEAVTHFNLSFRRERYLNSRMILYLT